MRHRVFLAAAWAACAVAGCWATVDRGLVHGVVDVLPSAVVALAATLTSGTTMRWGREVASSEVMLSLMLSAAVAVHLSGGLIEAHFLFFVAVGAAAAYQTWAPFLTAIGFVVVHHGVLGAFSQQAIFHHAAGQERPWLWTFVHGALLASAAAVGVASWRADEVVRARLATVGARSRLIVSTVEDGIVAVDEAGVVVDANPAAARILGGGPLVGRPLSDLLEVGGQDGQQPTGVAEPLPQDGPHRTGSGTPVAVRVATVHGDDAVRAVVTVRDLSSAARADTAERALAESAEREQVQRQDVAALMAAVRPPALTPEGLQVAVAYEPAASAPAGGDLYDWLVLPSGEVLVIVVDAMGRGTAATREALAVTSTVRTLAVAGCPLGELVARAGAVLDVTHPELLATLLIAAVDPRTGRVRLAGGGHPPAVLVTPAGAREVAADGLGVGYPDPGSFGTSEVRLGAGDTLVLYTDGLIEGTRDVVAGLTELTTTAAGMVTVPVQEFAQRLLTDVATCASQDDDCLAVVIRRPLVTATAPQGNGLAGSTSGPVELVHAVAPDVTQVRHARAAAAAWLDGWGVDRDVAETCTVLVSELVTNAVRHAGTPAQLRLRRHADEVHIEVADGLSTQPVLRDAPDAAATGGRGMQLVAALSTRWGTIRTGDGKVVWCAVAPQQRDGDTPPRAPVRPIWTGAAGPQTRCLTATLPNSIAAGTVRGDVSAQQPEQLVGQEHRPLTAVPGRADLHDAALGVVEHAAGMGARAEHSSSPDLERGGSVPSFGPSDEDRSSNPRVRAQAPPVRASAAAHASAT